MGVCCGSKNKADPVEGQKIIRKDPHRIVDHHQDLNKILDFWFDEDTQVGGRSRKYDRESTFPKALKAKWFMPNREVDTKVQKLFKQDFARLQNDRYTEWEDHHDGRLALILLSD